MGSADVNDDGVIISVDGRGERAIMRWWAETWQTIQQQTAQRG